MRIEFDDSVHFVLIGLYDSFWLLLFVFATMGSEANAVQLGNGEVKLVKLEENCVNVEAKTVVKHSPPSMMPVSPHASDEGIQVPSDFTMPSTVLTSPPELACVVAHKKCPAPGSPDASSPCTPKEGFFDPFAPGIDDFMMAPRGSKYSQETRSSAARSLNFGSSVKVAIDEYCESDAETASEEEMLLEFLYGDLLEVIVSTQVYSVPHEMCLDEVLVKHVILDGFKTPEPLLTGIADTCPPAPVKFARKVVKIDRGLCRKLEF